MTCGSGLWVCMCTIRLFKQYSPLRRTKQLQFKWPKYHGQDDRAKAELADTTNRQSLPGCIRHMVGDCTAARNPPTSTPNRTEFDKLCPQATPVAIPDLQRGAICAG